MKLAYFTLKLIRLKGNLFIKVTLKWKVRKPLRGANLSPLISGEM
jgi:hypothetical protein